MKNKPLLIALPITAAMLLMALWGTLQPRKVNAPLIPAGSVLTQPQSSPAIPRAAERPPEPYLTAVQPLPPPRVNNDPASGEVWLRLIDIDTSEPVVLKAGRALPMGGGATPAVGQPSRETYNWWKLGNEAFADGISRIETDADGLVRLAVRRQADMRHAKLAGPELIVGEHDRQMHFTLPVPAGYWPWLHDEALVRQLFWLFERPTDTPVDVPVRRNAQLTLSVIDSRGVPVSAPRVELALDITATGKRHLDCLVECGYLGSWTTAPAMRGWLDDKGDAWRAQGMLIQEPDGRPTAATSLTRIAELRDGIKRAPTWSSDALLPPGDYLIWAEHQSLGYGWQHVQLAPGRNWVELPIGAPVAAGIDLRVEYLRTPEAHPDNWSRELELKLKPTGYHGKSVGFGSQLESEWRVKATESGVWAYQLRGIPAGIWKLAVDHQHDTASAVLDLKPGQVQSLVLQVGGGAMGSWHPTVKFDGHVLTRARVLLLGGEYAEPTYVPLPGFDDGANEGIGLPAGDYTAWLPGTAPFNFSIKAGESRQDTFTIPSVRATFSISERLCDWLSGQHGQVALNLFAEDTRTENFEHLFGIDALLRRHNADYDLLKPGVLSKWTIPPARYGWSLQGMPKEIGGVIELRTAGPHSVHFDIDSLPGLATLRVELRGVEVGAEVRLSAESVSSWSPWSIGPARPEIWYRPPWPDGGQMKLSDNIFILFVKPGEVLVRAAVTQNLQTTTLQAVGRAPGDLQLNVPTLEYECILEVLQADRGQPVGLSEVWHDALGSIPLRVGQNRLPVGRLTGIATFGATGVARFDLELNPGRQQLVLAALAFERFGTLTVECRGIGAPGAMLDPWWSGTAPKPLLVELLDRPRGSRTETYSLSAPDRYVWGTAPGFVFEGAHLPPGRYRVIPWEGAEAKYCVNFEVKPGRHTHVTVRGG